MYQLLFRSRWIALVWVLATLASIAAFFSDGGGHQSLGVAAGEFAHTASPGGAREPTGFAPDEELAAETKADVALVRPSFADDPPEDAGELGLDASGTE